MCVSVCGVCTGKLTLKMIGCYLFFVGMGLVKARSEVVGMGLTQMYLIASIRLRGFFLIIL